MWLKRHEENENLRLFLDKKVSFSKEQCRASCNYLKFYQTLNEFWCLLMDEKLKDNNNSIVYRCSKCLKVFGE